ncbi:uncharacterized protein LOC130799660 [Amaranthus tricolor]|uniref:uncharacterized protein LOC130799660 n=1 Tax=Amaranthus tricolor TaxID=29722 RepID=UPI0025844F6E|nr:uncharacterized protein LOC130799660 [Amaranthus tricolor]
MRFFKKIAGFLGFAHENKEDQEEDSNFNNNNNLDENRRNRMNVDPIQRGPRKGFSVPVQVPVERHAVGPILIPCNGDGGVQGLKWYAERLRIDEDGDVADEFFHEVSLETSQVVQDQPRPMPRFQVKSSVRHAKVIQQQLTSDGKFQHLVESHGRLQWV